MLSDDQIRETLDEYSKIGPEPVPEVSLPSLSSLRRGHRPPVHRPIGHVRLIERDGLVFWKWGFANRPVMPATQVQRWRAGSGETDTGKEIFTQILKPLGVNQIGELLSDFDRKRNPAFAYPKGWELRQWHPGPQMLGDPDRKSAKKILLVIHGTASCAEHVFNEIRLTEDGSKLLADAAMHYSAVLAFEHPTISVSPILNALDLSLALSGYGDCAVDIICHSRGGLIASWWMHVIDNAARQKRCVFVGSPLQGTNLANPSTLRGSLHLLANYGRALGSIGIAAGFLTLPFTIIKVASSVVDFTAKTPLLDAVLAMIPGLGAQSSTQNNLELLRLNARKAAGQGAPTHFYIRANFASKDEGWKFWRYFTNDPKLRLIDRAVDTLVFPGENDLVVDTNSMLDVVTGPEFKFPSVNGLVHHTNYFQQQKTIEKIREWFAIPEIHPTITN